MIDIIALRKSYERKEIDEIRWIYGDDNTVDVMTKSNCNKALERHLDSNKLLVWIEGSVERGKVDAVGQR